MMLTEPPVIGAVNWRGVTTLYLKEVQRFIKVFWQTLVAPMVTTLLFLAVFSLALGGSVRTVGEVPFLEFLAPGLIMMAIVQNAFANGSSSLLIAKIQGNIVDVLMPPLSSGELAFGFVMGGVTRGVVVGIVVALGMTAFVPLGLHHPAAVAFFALAGALMLALIGVITGIWADRFDAMAAITNFAITPLAFLSGTFYSVERLPGIWHVVSQFNPFFYMIDGFRYGFIGHADGNLIAGLAVMAGINAALWWAATRLFASGYKIKA